eukprot:1922607-Amphidinium_carterae.1
MAGAFSCRASMCKQPFVPPPGCRQPPATPSLSDATSQWTFPALQPSSDARPPHDSNRRTPRNTPKQ